MDTILHFYFAVLEPFFRFFYPVCDWIFAWWVLYMPPVWAIVVMGFITGLGVNLFQKFFSNQKFLGACKNDLDLLNKRIAEAKKADDEEAFVRLNGLAKTIGGKYAFRSLLPSLWTIPPVIVLCMWIGSRLAFFPVQPGMEPEKAVRVTASMEASARGFATMLPCEGAEIRAMKWGETPKNEPEPIKDGDDEVTKMRKEALSQVSLEPFDSLVAPVLEGKEDPKKKDERIALTDDSSRPAWYKPWKWIYFQPGNEFKPWNWEIQDEKDRIAWVRDQVGKTAPPLGPEANWEVNFKKPGDYTLVIRYNDEDHPVNIKIREKGGHPPEIANYFCWSSPTEDQIQFVNFGLKDSMPSADWNLGWRWIGVYIIVAIVFGVGLRFALGVK